jgi:hypothetical protein
MVFGLPFRSVGGVFAWKCLRRGLQGYTACQIGKLGLIQTLAGTPGSLHDKGFFSEAA